MNEIHKPYWKALLGWGVGLGFIGGALFGFYASQRSTNYGHASPVMLLAALVFVLAAQVVLIPGLIGWGIDAAGGTGNSGDNRISL